MSIFKRTPKGAAEQEFTPPPFPKYRTPTMGDVEWQYASAQYWLAVAEQPGRDVRATTAAASCAQAHAALGQLAHAIMRDSKSASVHTAVNLRDMYAGLPRKNGVTPD